MVKSVGDEVTFLNFMVKYHTGKMKSTDVKHVKRKISDTG